MFGAITDFVAQHDWRLLAAAVVCLVACLFVIILYRRVHQQKMHFEAALNNMSEGLCMFDAATRLVLCNERYIEMYRLDPELAKPGALLRELLEQRKRSGTFAGDSDNYIEYALRGSARAAAQDIRDMRDGRVISVSTADARQRRSRPPGHHQRAAAGIGA
jgi:PAS domain-containing protein